MEKVIARIVLVTALCALGQQAFGSPQADTGSARVETGAKTLLVGTKEAAPFAFKDENGVWQGMAIELWTAIAADLGWTFEIREQSLEELLANTEDGSLDASVAAFTATAEREEVMDFAHPFFNSGLGIAIDPRGGQGGVALLLSLVSPAFLRALGALFLVLLVAGFLLWLFERKKNAEQFGGSTVEGLGSAFWWSAVTMTTVGYGDKAPTTLGGRLVALVWMFASIIIISGFTAAIASSLTVRSMAHPVQGEDDLANVRVGTVESTTSAAYLSADGVAAATFPDLATAFEALGNERIDALVYDAPILQHIARRDFPGRFKVLDRTFVRQDYAIMLPRESPLREPLNRVLLEKVGTDWWEDVVARYVGE